MEPRDVPSSSQRWQQVVALLESALDVAPEQRTAFLDRACPDDPALRREVVTLLKAHDRAGGFLEAFDAGQAAALVDSVGAPTRAGQRVGPYQLVREVGRGGMGTVYLAERATGQFDQQVALKLVKRGMDSDAILRRFLHERQILARLHHPHIARLYDGDVTDDGRPYFAMEYVEGVPLTRYCDDHRLGVEARLRLFQDVCRAVHYAHQNLIVHRDLKPSNMLVTEDGELKLLDFGIARVLGGEDDDGAQTLTEAGFRAMTPEYAAPEQVRGEAITTATDVYALGVVLYELLTGHRPYRFDRRTPEALAQVIGDVAPERPSTAVSREEAIQRADGTTETITPEAVSRSRSTQPERLQRRLRGDLDMVVMKALRKEPVRRYASAEAFVEDLRRHLAGLPVEARRDTVGYRMQKFVRRHTVGVAFAAVVGVLTLGGGVALAVQQARTAREAAKAEEVKDFVLNLFAVSDPDEAQGETITARALLDAGAARVETELSDQPEVQAEMMMVVGEIYRKLGLYDPAQRLLEQSLALRRDVLGADHEDVAASLHDLVSLLYDRGDFDAAEPLAREALTIRRTRLGADHEDTAASLHSLASLLRSQGHYEAAESLYREALAIRRSVLGAEHADVAHSLNGLALVLDEKGDYAAAEPLYREALAIRRAVLGPQHSDVTVSLNNLARLLGRQGDYAAAEPLYREALAIRRAVLGEEHPRVANSLNNLAGLVRRMGNYDEAEPLFREALAMKRKLLGEEHPEVAIGLNNLATVLRNKGTYDAAESFQREAIALWRKRLGADHPNVAIGLNNLARILGLKGDYAAAESLNREALALWRKRLGADHPRIADILDHLARLSADQGRYAAADSLFRETLAMRKKLLGPEHPDVATTLNNLGGLLRRKGDYAAAELLYQEALTMRRTLLGNEHPQVATALSNFAVLLREKGDYAAAEPLFREALAMGRKLLGNEHPSVATTLSGLALLLHQKGDYAAAELLYREALAMRRTLLGPEHPRVATVLNGMAALSAEQGDHEAAEALYREALAMRRTLLGPGHPDLATTLTGLGEVALAQERLEEAEPLLREALAIRARAFPTGDWRRAETQSVLGACLSGQGRYDEAEPLLLAGYEGVREAQGAPHAATRRVRDYLVAHYERRGQPEQAAAYRASE